jgi:hypothetical protein
MRRSRGPRELPQVRTGEGTGERGEHRLLRRGAERGAPALRPPWGVGGELRPTAGDQPQPPVLHLLLQVGLPYTLSYTLCPCAFSPFFPFLLVRPVLDVYMFFDESVWFILARICLVL